MALVAGLKRATDEGSLPEIARYSPYYLPLNVFIASKGSDLYILFTASKGVDLYIFSNCNHKRERRISKHTYKYLNGVGTISRVTLSVKKTIIIDCGIKITDKLITYFGIKIADKRITDCGIKIADKQL